MSSENEWVLANIKRAGFYRVNYNIENWNRIIAYLNSPSESLASIDVISRCQLIDDLFNLGRAEELPQTLYFDLLKYIIRRREVEAFPILTATSGLNFISKMVAIDNQTFQLHAVSNLLGNVLRLFISSISFNLSTSNDQDFIKRIFTSVYEKYGWANIPEDNIGIV